MFRVERADALARRLENGGILRLRLFGGVAEIAQDGEMNVRVQIAERLDLEMREQIVHPRDAVEHRRHDHHRPVGLRARARNSRRGRRRGGISRLIRRCRI